jgi:hypothetical protein
MVIRLEEIRETLRAHFGDLVPAEAIAPILRGWVPRQTDLHEVSEQLQDALCGALHDRLGDGLWMQTGTAWKRVGTRELANAADDLIGVLLMNLPEQSVNFEFVRSWAYESGSLSALVVLSRRFGAFQSPQEQRMIAGLAAQRWQEERT